MLRGITTAASGLLADERFQQLYSNNLTNLETPGFKESLGSALETPEQNIVSGPASDGFSTPIGTIGSGVLFQEGVPIFNEGQLQTTNRSLDVAIQDTTPSGSYGLVGTQGGQAGQSQQGAIDVSASGRLQVGSQSLAVTDANGNVVPGIYAELNPAYQGNSLYAADGSASYDANGNPSYQFVNSQNQVVGTPGHGAYTGYAVRVGTDADMGRHSFFAVAYQSPNVQDGVALTRDGHFSVNAENTLTDSNGNAVLPVGANGLPIPNGRIVLNTSYTGTDIFGANGAPAIDQNGQPSYRVEDTNGNVIPGGRLGTVDADVSELNPLGQTEFQVAGTLNSAAVLSHLTAGSGQLKPGELEGSNVDVTQTMTDMMNIQNSYQANATMLQTEDTELQKAVNDVGHVNA